MVFPTCISNPDNLPQFPKRNITYITSETQLNQNSPLSSVFVAQLARDSSNLSVIVLIHTYLNDGSCERRHPSTYEKIKHFHANFRIIIVRLYIKTSDARKSRIVPSQASVYLTGSC